MKVYVPNAVVQEWRLSGNQLKVFLFLLACRSGDTATVRIKTISSRCRLAVSTVSNALDALERCGKITRRHNYKNGCYATTTYTLSVPSGKFFVFDTKFCSFALSGSTLAVCCYLLSLSGETGKVWPSYTAISAAVGFCRNTVIRAVRVLQAIGKLAKAAVRAGKHNLYFLLLWGDKKRDVQARTYTSQYSRKRVTIAFVYNLTRFWKKVKSFLLKGSAKIEKQVLYPPYYNSKKKRNILKLLRVNRITQYLCNRGSAPF